MPPPRLIVVIVKRTRCSWLAVLVCVACGDSPTEAETGGSTEGSSGTSGVNTTPNPTTSADSDSGMATTAPTSGIDSTGGSTTEGEESESSTGTEPPHVTDFGLCDIQVMCDLEIVDEPKRSCSLTVTEADGYVVYDGPAGLEVRGRSSQGWPKHQYAVELWDNENIEFVPPSATWRYNDTADAGGSDWMQPEFDDSGWNEGSAPLGYGVIGPNGTNGGQPWAHSAQIANATITSFGPDPSNKYITSWFRTEFNVDDAATLDPVQLNLRADDGAIVYINGTEVVRYNLPAGAVGPTTLATNTIDYLEEIEFSTFPIDNTLLVDGTNVVAVELHQGSPGSSDISLDLALSTKPSGAPTNFYEFGRESDWIFNGAYFDMSLFRNKLMYDLFESFDPEDNYGPEGQYCELTLNGDPRGIYILGEKIKRDDDRVDIMPEMGAGESFIFKSDITKTWVQTYGASWQLVYPNEHTLSAGTAAGLNAYMSDFSDATTGIGNIWDYVDMDSAVDWILLQELARNGDAYSSSMHIYKDVGGRIRFVPWDFDIGLSGGCSGPEGWLYRGSSHWLNSMTEDPAFQASFVARWAELRETVLSEESIDAQIDGYAETMTPEAIAANSLRWPHDEIIGGDDWVLQFRNNCPVSSWEEEHEFVTDWISERLIWMDNNIDSYN